MTENVHDRSELSADELRTQAAEPSPDRAAMSPVNADVTGPINPAVALNALSDAAVAYVTATQTARITRST